MDGYVYIRVGVGQGGRSGFRQVSSNSICKKPFHDSALVYAREGGITRDCGRREEDGETFRSAKNIS